jgi:hypothetical protein
MSWGALFPGIVAAVYGFVAVTCWRLSKGGAALCLLVSLLALSVLLSGCAHRPCTMHEWAGSPNCT